MITFVHTADIHFGMENYGKIDAKTGIHSRLLDFEKALNFCIDHAIEKKVDFFLFCGDAYKTTNPSPTQQRLLFKCFLRLHKAHIPIISVIGNHDNPLSFGKANTLDILGDLPLDGFHVITKPSILNLQTKSGPINIVGIPWPNRTNISLTHAHLAKTASELTNYISQAVGSIIANLAQQLDPDTPALLAGHLTVSSGTFSGSEKRAIYGNDPLLLPSQLALAPFDYVALGHLHRYQNLNPHGYPAIVYSGSIERIDFGERKEEKGFCVVSIPAKGTATHEFITVPTRPFLQLDIKLLAHIDQTKQILEELEKYHIANAIVKIIYHIPAGKKDMVDLNKIEQACSRAMDLIGIIPIHIAPIREKRISMKIDMDMATLLSSYFDSKPELTQQKERLIEKIMILQDEQTALELE